jgi:hypothetical protein
MTPETRSYMRQARNLLPKIAAAVKAQRVQNDPLRHIQLQCYADEISGMVDVLIEAEDLMEKDS